MRIYYRYDQIKDETGTYLYDDDLIPDNIYNPIVCIDDGKVRGSCKMYTKRINITNKVVGNSKIAKLEELFKEFDKSKVVLVASQKLRAISLFGHDLWRHYLDFRIEEYVILENVGRTRDCGEISVGKEAPVYENPLFKTSRYVFKTLLVNQGLILQFPIFLYLKQRKMMQNCLVMFLPRFRSQKASLVNFNVWKLCCCFVKNQKQFLPLETLFIDSKYESSKSLKRFIIKNSTCFKIVQQENSEEVFVEYLKPIYRGIAVYECSEKSKEELCLLDESQDSIEGKESQDVETENIFQINIIKRKLFSSQEIIDSTDFDWDRLKVEWKVLNINFLAKIYLCIMSSGERGVSTCELSKFLDIPRLHVRNSLKMLKKDGFVLTTKIQHGRSRSFNFKIANKSNLASNLDDLTSELTSRVLNRMQMIEDYLKEKLFILNTFHFLKSYIWALEKDVSYTCDHRTLCRILSQMHQKKMIQLFLNQLSYKNVIRNVNLVSVRLSLVEASANNYCPQAMVNHFLERFKFEYFNNYKIDLQKDILVKSLDDFYNLDPRSSLMDFESSISTGHYDDSPKLHPVSEPTLAVQLYKPYESRLERTFEMYRFLFHLFVPSNETYAQSDWRFHVPKLVNVFIGNL